MNCVQSGIILLCVFTILVNGQQFGMDPNLMGGYPGSVPMHMDPEATALYARGFNSDQIDDILAEPPHLRPMEEARQRSQSAMEAARHTAQNALMSAMLGGAAVNSAGGALSYGACAGTHAGSVSQGGGAGVGLGSDLFIGSGATGGADSAVLAAGMKSPMRPAGSSSAGAVSNVVGAHAHAGSVAKGGAGGAGLDLFGMGAATRGADSTGLAAGMMNPMGSGSQFAPGMDANLVANLMGGHMHMAQETAALRARGFNPDAIDDILAEPPHLRPMEEARQAQQSAMEAASHTAQNALMSAMLGGAAGAQHAGPGGVNMYQPNPQRG